MKTRQGSFVTSRPFTDVTPSLGQLPRFVKIYIDFGLMLKCPKSVKLSLCSSKLYDRFKSY